MPLNHSPRQRAFILLLMTATLWSLGGLLIKSVEWSAPAIAGSRSAIAAIVIYLALRRPRITLSKDQIGGAVAYAATVILFVLATRTTTAANAILLQYTAPIYVALLSPWFLGEKIRAADWISTAVIFSGISLFFLDELAAGHLLGNLYAIASGISFAFLALLLRRQKEGSPAESVLLGNILTAVLCFPFYFQSAPTAASLLPLFLLGTFQLGLSYVLFSHAIKHVFALEATLITMLEPVLNPVWVLLYLGETPGFWALAGGFVVLTTLVLRAAWGARLLARSRSAPWGARG